MSRPLKMRWANYISTFMVDWFSINSRLGIWYEIYKHKETLLILLDLTV